MRLPIELAYPPKARLRAARPKAWAFVMSPAAEANPIIWRPVERLITTAAAHRMPPPKFRDRS